MKITAEILIANKIPVIDDSEWGIKNKLCAVKCDEGFIVWNFIKGFAIKINNTEQLKYVW